VASLGDQLTLVEAGIDFTDQEDVVPITRDDLATKLMKIIAQLKDLLAHSRSWGTLEALPRVVLAGAAGSGKSTLFNALLGRRRAIVSPLPGTTRDVLAEPLMLASEQGHPFEVMLVDVAGLDAPASTLDLAALAAAHRAHEQADLILHLDDGGAESPTFEAPCRATCPIIRIQSKSDLSGHRVPEAATALSAHTGAGLEQLRRLIVQRIGAAAVSVSADMLALQPRHEAAMQSAVDHLNEASRLLEAQVQTRSIESIELVATTMRAALDELAGLGGGLTPDDVISRIFSKFCIGK
jgi:tRNA modification GTPase